MPDYVSRCPRAKIEDWGDAPAALGLEVDGEGALFGRWSGLAVRALHRCVSEQTRVEEPFRTGPSDGSNWHYETGYTFLTRFEAALDPPLRLALTARQIPPVAPNRTSFDPARGAGVEPHFAFYGFDREHTQRVLAAVMPEVLRDADQDPLLGPGRPSAGTYNLMLTDAAVSALSVVPDFVVDPDALRLGIERVAQVAEALLQARARELAPDEPQARSEWATAAAGLGLVFDPAGLRMAGEVDGLGVDVRATVEPNPDPGRLPTHRSTRIDVTFARPLGFPWSLSRQAAPAGGVRGLLSRVFGPQDLTMGDAAFDAAFEVRGPADQTRALLPAPTRERLLAALRLEDSLGGTERGLAVCVPELVLASAKLDGLVRSLAAAAASLEGR